jgi:hypothetical protein
VLCVGDRNACMSQLLAPLHIFYWTSLERGDTESIVWIVLWKGRLPCVVTTISYKNVDSGFCILILKHKSPFI